MATGTKRTKPRPPREPSELELTWEIARLFPPQGAWSEEEYFGLNTNRRIEYCNGRLEFLPMPTIFHQLIMKFIFLQLDAFVTDRKLGLVVPAGYKVRVGSGRYREPDIVFIAVAHMSGIDKQYCKKADLVVEVVSEENRPLDIETKREEYARAGIPEYWIVDPEEETITVLVLKSRLKTYVEHGRFGKGTRATSKLLPGFSVDVTTALAQKPELPK
jgi:Uma2 family endonuclease